MPETKGLRLGEILLERGLITQDQLDEALETQKTKQKLLGEILIEKEFITDQQLTEILADLYQLPFVNISSVSIDKKLIEMFPYSFLNRYKIWPIEVKDNDLIVATNNPLNIDAFQSMRHSTGYSVKPVITPLQQIEKVLEQFGESMKAMEAIKAAKDPKSEEAPIMKLVDAILRKAIKEKVSDIHVEGLSDRVRVRFRIDGILHDKVTAPKNLQSKIISRIKILSEMDVAETRKPQDGRLSLSEGGKEYDMRVSSMPDTEGESIVLRILDKGNVNLSFDTLGMTEEEIDLVKRFISHSFGVILVTGPTGSGKTTTLYTMLNILNEISTNIITVEDPVEYALEGITQTAVNVQSGYTFAAAIRQMLRHDPDIIMVGEVRDLETAEIAVRAALTGHLVFSTLHTNSAPGTVTRLLDMNVAPFLISSAVIGIIAQRLVRGLCPVCQKEYEPSEEIKATLSKVMTIPKNVKLAQPVGCEKCFQTGYKGRVGIYEILNMSEEIKRLVLKEATEQEITKLAMSEGLNTLKMSGIKKALDQRSSFEEVMRVVFID